MSKLITIDTPTPKTSEKDPRIGHLVGRALDSNKKPRAVIIGFPSDTGVKRNGGRTGASEATRAVRSELYRMTPDAEDTVTFRKLIEQTDDLGDINVTGGLKSDQRELGKVVGRQISNQIIPVIIGGGHETAFGHFLGYAEAGIKTAVINLDAHADVRPLINGKAHSGSPFRQAIEHDSECCKQYLAAGLQPYTVAGSHLEFIKLNGGRFLFRDETNITRFSGLFDECESDRIMVTFDMDAVDQAFAPGVSAPCINGLDPGLWLTAAYLAGRNKNVMSFDLSEVNPDYDRDNQTTKLAALTIWHFLLGLSQR